GLANLLGAIRFAGVEGVGGAELTGQSQFLVGQVDRDDALRAGDARAEEAAQADAAETDDRHHVAGPHARGIDGGADAGLHRAAEHGRIDERHALVDLYQRGAGDHRVLGEAGNARIVRDEGAVAAEPPAAGQEFAARAQFGPTLAHVGLAARAIAAGAAAR